MKVALIVLVSLSVATAVSVSTLVADEWKLFKVLIIVNLFKTVLLTLFSLTESSPEVLQ